MFHRSVCVCLFVVRILVGAHACSTTRRATLGSAVVILGSTVVALGSTVVALGSAVVLGRHAVVLWWY